MEEYLYLISGVKVIIASNNAHIFRSYTLCHRYFGICEVTRSKILLHKLFKVADSVSDKNLEVWFLLNLNFFVVFPILFSLGVSETINLQELATYYLDASKAEYPTKSYLADIIFVTL